MQLSSLSISFLVSTYWAISPVQSFSPTLKNVGCGLPNVPAGDKSLFDPDEEGKLQGTGVINERIAKGSSFEYVDSNAVMARSNLNAAGQDLGKVSPKVELVDAQHWLEHLDEDGNLPLNFDKPNNPVIASVLGRARIISEDAPGDIQHIVLKLPDGMHYVEGQSLSVIPPGIDPKTGRSHTLVSIPSHLLVTETFQMVIQ